MLIVFKPKTSILQILDEWEFLIAPLLFTLVSFFTRMYKIGLSNIVTWDEAQYAIPYDIPADDPIYIVWSSY